MKNKIFKIKIDGKEIKASKGQTILEAAEESGVSIPALCYHSDLEVKANCRVCVAEIKGRKGLHTACSTKAEPGMEVFIDSEKAKRARKINLELLFSQHQEECADCVWNLRCELLRLAKEYNVEITRFKDRKTGFPVYDFGPALQFDSSKCIDCRNCVEMCHKQGVDFLEIKGKGSFFEVVPTRDKKRDCIYCGQCLMHCPAGAFEAVGEFEKIEEPLLDKNKVVVFQFAPSVRASIGEEFGMPYGANVTGKLSAGIRRLGASRVFDVAVGADFTTVEEAKELAERLEKPENLPMFTSCCPGWVKFAEFFYPEFIPNLTTVRSPHILLGGLIKTYWAKKEEINPKDIVVVSVMPCVAKKYEIERKELKIKGHKPVDYVLTVRELARLFLKHNINLKTITPQKPDNPLAIPAGAGVIFGASGGVMESALRAACSMLSKEKLCAIDYKEVRGLQGVKKAKVKIGKKVLKIAVVNGTGNVRIILEELKKNPKAYDYIEVMACPGGCVGGGGQPLPADEEIRKKRAAALYGIDRKKEIRLAQENPIVKQVYEEFFVEKENIHKVCHTRYLPKKRETG